MFERFTDAARHAVTLAQAEARDMGHDHVGTEHLAIGLAREKEGLAAHVLRHFGIEADRLRDDVLLVVGPGAGAPRGRIRLTARSKNALKLALREALALGHDYIGTEHLLLGLVREAEGVGARVLAAAGADAAAVRDHILTLLRGPRGRPRPDASSSRAGVDWAAALVGAAASFAEGRGRAPAVRVALADGERFFIRSIDPGAAAGLLGLVAYEVETGARTRLALVRPGSIARADVTVDPGDCEFVGLGPDPADPIP